MKYLKFLLKLILRNEFLALEKELREYKELAETYKRNADTDPLTHCLNRRGMEAQWQSLIDDRRQSIRTYPNVMGLIMIDLDKFKGVNDTYGHDAGDDVIRHAAEAMQAGCRKGDAVVRLGGDEFVVILLSADPMITHTRTYVETRAQQIRLAIENSLKEFSITASIGITVANTNGDRRSLDSHLKRADEAMYQAKANGGNCIVFAPKSDNKKSRPVTTRRENITFGLEA